jgi:hypothetical protein
MTLQPRVSNSPGNAGGNDATVPVDDLHLDMRLDAPDRRDAALERIVMGALEADRGHGVRSRSLALGYAVVFSCARGFGRSVSYHGSRRKAAGFRPSMRHAPIMPRPMVKRRPPIAAASADLQSKTKSENMIRLTTR